VGEAPHALLSTRRRLSRPSEAVVTFIDGERAKWPEVVKAAGVKMD
jgi:hypothetical protein